MLYELWDTESGTLLGAYSTEAEALAVVGANVQQHGADYVVGWSLGRLDSDQPVLEGAPLVQRARAAIMAG